MDKLQSIQQQIESLSPEELTAFRRWFVRFDVAAWYRWFDGHVESGKLDALADQAIRDFEAGKGIKL
jgi:hypothetical protein